MKRSAFPVLAVLLGLVGVAGAQTELNANERRVVEEMAQGFLEQCKAAPLFERGTRPDHATSFDLGSYCTCQSQAVRNEVTPELLRRNSAREGAALRESIIERCQASELLASFGRDCPSIVSRTQDLDASARRGRRLQNAGGTASLCACLVQRFRAKPTDDYVDDAREVIGMINVARRTAAPTTLDLLLNEDDLEACRWRLEADAGGPPARAQEGGRAAAASTEVAIDKADLPLMGRAVDTAFAQWAAQWMWDRYLRDSVSITESRMKNGVALVRGTFRFSRGAAVATIPFASTLQKQKSNWLVTTLCYNDTTSGMTDCANSGLSAGARNFMGAAILGGLLAAINGYDGSSDGARGDAAGRDFEARRREREDEESRKAARQRENDQLDRDWTRMFEPSPLLPPPQTIN